MVTSTSRPTRAKLASEKLLVVIQERSKRPPLHLHHWTRSIYSNNNAWDPVATFFSLMLLYVWYMSPYPIPMTSGYANKIMNYELQPKLSSTSSKPFAYLYVSWYFVFRQKSWIFDQPTSFDQSSNSCNYLVWFLLPVVYHKKGLITA